MSGSGAYQVVVIGAGISGLVCAWRLASTGVRTALLESSSRIGGVIHSERVDGYLLERGPSTLLAKPAALSLIEELGLRERAEIQPMKCHKRFIWRDGKLRVVPTNPIAFFASTLLSLGDKYDILHGLVARYRPPSADMELGAYCRERLGNGAVDALLKPALAGVYAANADRISLEATASKLFPILKQCERLSGVAKALKAQRAEKPDRGLRALVSFDEGLQAIPNAIAERFRSAGGELRLNCAVTGLTGAVSGTEAGWNIRLNNGEEFHAETVVLTPSAGRTASVLDDVVPEVASALKQIEHAPLAIAHVGAAEDQFADSRRAFGFLTVQNHGVRMLGAIWNDRVFSNRAPSGRRLITCFLGGEIDPHAVSLSDAKLREQTVADLTKTMQLRSDAFELFQVTRYKDALPIFRVGHVQKMEQMSARVPAGLRLLGNYVGGVSIPDRIEAANIEAESIISQFRAERVTAVA